MKLSPLLAQFLLINKQLNLTGIGRFKLDDSFAIPEENSKNQKGLSIGKIIFEQDASVREDPQLINFMAEHSGKMKSLAAADLDSHMELARQFLNIGKPFLFEGIGTLTKTKTGKFEFFQSNTYTEKLKDNTGEGQDQTSTTEESFTNYEEMFSPKKPKTPASRRIATWLIAAVGIGLAVFGGYIVYNKTKPKNRSITTSNETTLVSPAPVSVDTTRNVPDSSGKTVDSLTLVTNEPKPQLKEENDNNRLKNYRFVIETAQRQRAFYRYNFLRENYINVSMDTKDSSTFKLFFLLPSLPSDTTKKRDSLQRLYGTRMKTVIELN